MSGKIIIPVYRSWLHGFYWLHKRRCPLHEKGHETSSLIHSLLDICRRITWWRHQMETFSALLALTKASDAALWCLLWSASWINGWVNNREAGNLRCHCAHYDVIVMNWWMTSNGHHNTPVLSPINLVCGYFINTRERFNVRKPCHKLMRFGEKYIIANFRDKQINQ